MSLFCFFFWIEFLYSTRDQEKVWTEWIHVIVFSSRDFYASHVNYKFPALSCIEQLFSVKSVKYSQIYSIYDQIQTRSRGGGGGVIYKPEP